MGNQPAALIIDFGGVLTNDFWEVLRDFARREGLPEAALIDLITRDRAGGALLRALERGDVGQAEFERRVAAVLGVPLRRVCLRNGDSACRSKPEPRLMPLRAVAADGLAEQSALGHSPGGGQSGVPVVELGLLLRCRYPGRGDGLDDGWYAGGDLPGGTVAGRWLGRGGAH